MKILDLVIGRRGDSVSGRVLDKAFRIRATLGTLTVSVKQIAWIHFGDQKEGQPDEIWLHSSDRLSGAILGGAMSFRELGGSTMKIPFAAIHTVMLNASVDPGSPPLGPAR